MESDIHPVDASAFYASTAISLKRIADALDAKNRLDAIRLYAQEIADADKADDWLVLHRLSDLIEDPVRREAARKRVMSEN